MALSKHRIKGECIFDALRVFTLIKIQVKSYWERAERQGIEGGKEERT
jgi:hypothetical protein